MPREPSQRASVAATYADRHPRDILALALNEYGGEIGISFSGAEDVVLVHMAREIGGSFRVFSLDTGRLHGGMNPANYLVRGRQPTGFRASPAA